MRFFKKAIRQHGQPDGVTMDKSGANKAAVDELNQGKPKDNDIIIRQNKYLNNLIEQDHRNVKCQTANTSYAGVQKPQTVLAGIEWVCMLSKGQYRQKEGCLISPTAFFYQLVE